jgi:16S rRNA (guanine(966)-N(2))-methyltransferase RsmD
MRVISGKAKGRKLNAPSSGIRPLSEQAREALFNILGERVIGAYFLDLFAGTGAVGIEALSRGAKLSIFVEISKRTVEIIRGNLRSTELYEFGEVYSVDALLAVKILDTKKSKFDIIYLGPPYDSPILEKALVVLSEADILNPDGIIVAEHRAKQKIGEAYRDIFKIRDSRYGDTVLSFYRRK